MMSLMNIGISNISRDDIGRDNINASALTLFICSFICSLILIGSIPVSFAEEKKADTTPEKAEQLTKKISPITKPISLTKQHKSDLNHYLSAEQLKPLLAGPDDYLTLVKKYTSANSKGVAILLPEWQQGATNPKAINYLRNTLPAKGWSTIAIQPNNKPDNYPSTAITIEAQKEENQLALDDYKNKLSTMMNAIMNTAKEYPGIVLVIAQGNNAALLIDLYSQKNSQRPNALIMLSSYRNSNHAFINSVNEEFAKQLATIELPVLDLYLQHDNPLVLAKAPQRKALAKQEMKVYYRQRQLNNTVTSYYPEATLLSQINGWLKAIGW